LRIEDFVLALMRAEDQWQSRLDAWMGRVPVKPFHTTTPFIQHCSIICEFHSYNTIVLLVPRLSVF